MNIEREREKREKQGIKWDVCVCVLLVKKERENRVCISCSSTEFTVLQTGRMGHEWVFTFEKHYNLAMALPMPSSPDETWSNRVCLESNLL